MNSKEIIRTFIFGVGRLLNCTEASRVVYYHDIHIREKYTPMSTAFNLFKTQINVIRQEHFSIVRDINSVENQIQVAFDDGFRGIWECAEWLVAEKIYPTIFIPISLIGQKGYLSASEIVALHNVGFNIQSHGVRHSNMSIMPMDKLTNDLQSSKQYLEDLLGKEINGVCFPQGYFSDIVISKAQQLGYTELYASFPRRYLLDNPLKGRSLFQSLSPLQVRLAIHGGMDILMEHYRRLHYNTKRFYQ